FLRYFGSETDNDNQDTEVLIVVIPHIIRTPNITAENLRSIASGTDTNPEIRLESVVMSPNAIQNVPGAAAAGAAAAPGTGAAAAPAPPAVNAAPAGAAS